jgi:transglutaminase-like putative cysteine protease
MRRLHILHRTHYSFVGPVRLGPHRLMLRPREGHDVRIESATLELVPTAVLRWSRDEYDNSFVTATFDNFAQQLTISSEVVIRHDDASPLDFLVEDYAVNYPFRLARHTELALSPFLDWHESPTDSEALRSWLSGLWNADEPIQTYALLWRICTEINRSLSYYRREEPGVQSASETLSRRSGSCRDFAHLFMCAARYLRVPARFVSGYLYAPQSAADFGATHAWSEVYLPGAGWRGFDPTIGELASSKHIRVAIGRVADAVPPVSGTFFGPIGASMSVGVWVSELPQGGGV